MKNLVEMFANTNLPFSDDSKMHLFLLAINQVLVFQQLLLFIN